MTFANKPKLHHFTKDNQWRDATDFPLSNNPYSHNPQHQQSPHTLQPHNKPVLPMRDYVRSPSTSSSHSQQNIPTYGNKLSPINDASSQMTSYDDDDETTTSGSYTIDNDHDWTNESQQPRPYFLSHNEAYC